MKVAPPSTQALAAAIMQRADKHVRQMLADGADACASHQGASLLELAFEQQAPLCMHALLEYGADPNQVFCDGLSVVHWAVTLHNIPLLEKLGERGANFNTPNPARAGGSPLTYATIGASRLVIGKLLDLGADPNWLDEDGRTPLHHAARGGNTTAVTLLLNAGARPDLRDHYGRAPSFYAKELFDDHQGGRGRDILDLLRPLAELGALEGAVSPGPAFPQRRM